MSDQPVSRRDALLAATALGASVLGAAQADEKPVVHVALPPGAVPPRFVTIGRIDEEKREIVLHEPSVRFVWNPDRRAVYEVRVWTLLLNSIEAFDVNNNKLPKDQLWKRLAVGTVAAVSPDAKKIDPFFLKALAKDTVVFVSLEYAVNHVRRSGQPEPEEFR